MGDAERRPMPSVLLVILAMLGLASFQKFTGPAPGPDPELGLETKGRRRRPRPTRCRGVVAGGFPISPKPGSWGR